MLPLTLKCTRACGLFYLFVDFVIKTCTNTHTRIGNMNERTWDTWSGGPVHNKSHMMVFCTHIFRGGGENYVDNKMDRSEQNSCMN